ncbi:MAG: hypothetical protein LBT95_03890 [Treponema sp.]|jgi:hypothetical protein|nr:hypothetical protein [Treponema sp.]
MFLIFNKFGRFFAGLLLLFLSGPLLLGQSVQDKGASPSETAPPLRRIALFSSGVGFFEHSGRITGPTAFTLPFHVNTVKDVLKSLILAETPPEASDQGGSPSVTYPAEAALDRTLQSLRVDLSGNPGIAELLNKLRGAEIEVSAPGAISGRIIGVEYRPSGIQPRWGEAAENEAYLSLFTPQGIRIIGLKEIASFSFKDPELNADLNRALDLITASRDEEIRNLKVNLPGRGNRDLVLSYVIPAAVWKVSYRLDLSREKPLLQGWAIVDNDSDTDWEEVELSLVTGRPVSFIQNLYTPYHLARPVLPLAIAGTAQAETYASGWAAEEPARAAKARFPAQAAADMAEQDSSFPRAEAMREMAAPIPSAAYNLTQGTVTAARGAELGEQFEFTLKQPVNLARRQSAMLPLVEGTVDAKKAVIFSGAKALGGGPIHPAIGVELANTTGLKLPAGPVTVYDGGAYAGDALIEFFPAGENRFISYGEDLSVSGSLTASNTRTISAVTIRGGIMTVSRKQGYEKAYTLRNASGDAKRLILEHPVTAEAALVEPKDFKERTGSLYRFERTLPGGQELTLTVREEAPLLERIVLSQLRPESLAAYTVNREIPPAVRDALQRAIALKQKADEAQAALSTLENQKNRLVTEQERIRRNLEAAGSGTQQGQEYLRRLALTDGDIDAVHAAIETAEKNLLTARQAYETYLGSMELEE